MALTQKQNFGDQDSDSALNSGNLIKLTQFFPEDLI